MPKLTSEIPASGTQKSIIRRRLGHVPLGMSYDEAETIIARLNMASDLPYCHDEGIIAALNAYMALARNKASKDEFLAIPFEPTWVVQGINIEITERSLELVRFNLVEHGVILGSGTGVCRMVKIKKNAEPIPRGAFEDAYWEALQWILSNQGNVS